MWQKRLLSQGLCWYLLFAQLQLPEDFIYVYDDDACAIALAENTLSSAKSHFSRMSAQRKIVEDILTPGLRDEKRLRGTGNSL